jgi:hypothetical protein
VTLELRKQVGVTIVSEETAGSFNVTAVFLETAYVYKTTRRHTQEEGTLHVTAVRSLNLTELC